MAFRVARALSRERLDGRKASSFVCLAERDGDDNQSPAPKYVHDGDNYPIAPIDDRDRRRDHENR